MKLNHIIVTRPEYQKTLFNKVVGKSGKAWYYNGDPSSVWVDGDGQGMGGRTVTYEMLEGDVEEVKGPWQGNATALKQDTGVDLTQNFWSYGLVFASRADSIRFEKGEDVEPVVMDSDWTRGSYDGGVERMKDMLIAMGLDYNSSLDIVLINTLGGVSMQNATRSYGVKV
jgi:hypothetical protein